MSDDIGDELPLAGMDEDDGFEVSPIDVDEPAEFLDVPATNDDDFESFELELVEELFRVKIFELIMLQST